MKVEQIFDSKENVLERKSRYEAYLLEVIFKYKYGEIHSCPNCKTSPALFRKITNRRSYQCAKCAYQLYPTAGTVFEKSTTPLICWFYIIHLFITGKKLFIDDIRKDIGTTYKTAWRMYHMVKEIINIIDPEFKNIYYIEVDESKIEDWGNTADLAIAPTTDSFKWLLSDEDFESICNVEKFNEWGLNVLWENGITCPTDSYDRLCLIRFEYGKPKCPLCEVQDDHYKLNDKRWKCKKCHNKFSVTSNTYLNDTKLEYYHWIRFAYLVGEMKIINSLIIAVDLGITQPSAWEMIQTLRTAHKASVDYKFINGQSVLVFKNMHEVLDVLLKRINQKQASPSLLETSTVQQVGGTSADKEDAINGPGSDIIVPEESMPHTTTENASQVTPVIIEKKCQRKECGKIKPLTEFYKGGGNYGVQSYCKECTKELGRIQREKKISELKSVEKNISEPIISDAETESKIQTIEHPTISIEMAIPTTLPSEKQCQRKECMKTKPLTDFYKGKGSDGFQIYCKKCTDELSKISRKNKNKRKKQEKETTVIPEPIAIESVVEATPAHPISAETIPSVSITEKQCKRKECKKIKPLSEFYKQKTTADGLAVYCKECVQRLGKNNYLKRSQARIQIQKESKSKEKPEQKKQAPAESIVSKKSKSEAVQEFKRNNVLKFLKL